jgi:hypothetical protein
MRFSQGLERIKGIELMPASQPLYAESPYNVSSGHLFPGFLGELIDGSCLTVSSYLQTVDWNEGKVSRG